VNGAALSLAIESLQPHVLAISLISARLIPVAFLCPLFGGSHAPSHVKLGTVLALALFVHFAGGIGAPHAATAFELGALMVKEVVFGLTLGLIAALPFDIGGRALGGLGVALARRAGLGFQRQQCRAVRQRGRKQRQPGEKGRYAARRGVFSVSRHEAFSRKGPVGQRRRCTTATTPAASMNAKVTTAPTTR
jgi:hypothetical protein